MHSLGSKVQGKLVEEIEKDQWIVSFDGHLVRVRNTTSMGFEEGRVLSLEVVGVNPLALKVLVPRKNRINPVDFRI